VETSAYDEQRVLAQYLWHNYANLFPSEHREVMKALIGDAKASVARDSLLVNRIRMIFGSTAAGKVAEQLSDGESAFQSGLASNFSLSTPVKLLSIGVPGALASYVRLRQNNVCGAVMIGMQPNSTPHRTRVEQCTSARYGQSRAGERER